MARIKKAFFEPVGKQPIPSGIESEAQPKNFSVPSEEMGESKNTLKKNGPS
jgi:hypothetical protein